MLRDLSRELRGTVRAVLRFQLNEVRYSHSPSMAARQTIVADMAAQIDRFLHKYCMEEAASEAGWVLRYIDKYHIEKEWGDVISRRLVISSPQPEHLQQCKHGEKSQKKTSEWLRPVLVYRGLVMAAFLSTSVDISCVADTELGKKIVQFI